MEGQYGDRPQYFPSIYDNCTIEGSWWCRDPDKEDIDGKKIQPHGNDTPSSIKIEIALRHCNAYILLRHDGISTCHLALLIVPFQVPNLKRGSVLKRQFIGAVIEGEEDPGFEDEDSLSGQYNSRIGGKRMDNIGLRDIVIGEPDRMAGGIRQYDPKRAKLLDLCE